MKLNPKQKKAAHSNIGMHAKIVAGAGTGKTRVLVARVIYLVKSLEIDIKTLCLVAFTNNAANEISERLKKALGKDAASIATTFHKFCILILKECPTSKLKKFKILDEKAQTSIIQKLLKKHDLQLSVKAKDIVSRINRSRTIEEHPVIALTNQNAITKEQAKLFIKSYEEEKRRASSMDFNDIILETEKLLKKCKAAEWAAKRCQYLLIDEAQDLNSLQWNIVGSLANNGTTIFCVGDPAQAIFGFSGALVEKFTMLEARYHPVKTYHLARNYRCSPEIVELSNWQRSEINEQLKQITSKSVNADKPVISDFEDLEEAYKWVIKSLRKNGILKQQLDEPKRETIAILVKTNKIKEFIVEELGKARIPLKKKGCKHGVEILTVHKAKGKEWDTCYVIDPRISGGGWNGMLDYLWNNKQTEMCLWYVAVTRAKRKLYICSSTSRIAIYSDAKRNEKYILDCIPPRFHQFKS